MPVYLYSCPIHNEFEVEHSIKEILTDCPKCQEEKKEPQKITRLISGGTSFVLNGTGWANNGYS